MIEIGNEMTNAFLKSQVGKSAEVLFERPCGIGLYEGFTKNYAKVIKKSDVDISGEIQSVIITSVEGDHLLAD